MEAAPIDVCIAIPTWNRSTLLRESLESLTRLRVPPEVGWEVVVVDNGCTDDTAAVVADFADRLPALRRVSEPVPGLSAARNRALDACNARHLLFIDDDARVASGWLEAFVSAARDYPEAGVFGGPVVPWFPTPPDRELLEAFPLVRRGFCGLDHGRARGHLPAPMRLVGANMAFRTDAVLGLRFDTRLGVQRMSLIGGEEDQFITALRERGVDVVWVPEMAIEHTVDPSRLEVSYLMRYFRDRARTRIRLLGPPAGPRVGGVPLRFLSLYLSALVQLVPKICRGNRVQIARQRAKLERRRGKITECRALHRSARVGREPEAAKALASTPTGATR